MVAPSGATNRRLVTFGVPLLFLMAFASLAMAIVAAHGDVPAEVNDDPSPPSSGSLSSGSIIEMQSDLFVPATIEVAAGTTVTWTNTDPVVHTVNEKDRLFVSENLFPGDSYSFTFDAPGTYQYVCILHTGMAGTVVVT